MTESTIRLTQYSHGAGCGCKISPALLDEILGNALVGTSADPRLLVGNDSRDDAAVYDLGDGSAVISTTDFFMPIVDDPYTFGRIAATNAISDIYAMGGEPLMAIAIFGWPIDKLGPDVAAAVIDGGRAACRDAGIPLAGGHSIDAPEPIFGLAVTGRVEQDRLKRNDTAQPGDKLFLTKPLGVGILTTSQKSGVLKPEHAELAPSVMCQLNKVGRALSALPGVTAMTDVTGFGLGGHLLEMCRGSDVAAEVDFAALPLIESVADYLAQGQTPGGTGRNFASYGSGLGEMADDVRSIICDPQTSGGLLVAVRPEAEADVARLLADHGLHAEAIGELLSAQSDVPVRVRVRA